MRPMFAFVTVLLMLAATVNSAPAATVELPVEGLNGYYGPDTTQVVGTFNVSFEQSDILSARLRITGHLVWPSYYGCPNGDAGVNGCYFFATMSTSSGEWFTYNSYVDQRVSFVAFLDWHASGGATWEFLSGDTGAVVLSCFSRPLPAGCRYQHGSSDTTAEVIDAKIIFELSEPTPVEQSTWGRIKSLFLSH